VEDLLPEGADQEIAAKSRLAAKPPNVRPRCYEVLLPGAVTALSDAFSLGPPIAALDACGKRDDFHQRARLKRGGVVANIDSEHAEILEEAGIQVTEQECRSAVARNANCDQIAHDTRRRRPKWDT
jgi:hypothetical protein